MVPRPLNHHDLPLRKKVALPDLPRRADKSADRVADRIRELNLDERWKDPFSAPFLTSSRVRGSRVLFHAAGTLEFRVDMQIQKWLVGRLQEGAGRRRKDARDAVTRRESGYPFSKLLRARGAVPNV